MLPIENCLVVLQDATSCYPPVIMEENPSVVRYHKEKEHCEKRNDSITLFEEGLCFVLFVLPGSSAESVLPFFDPASILDPSNQRFVFPVALFYDPAVVVDLSNQRSVFPVVLFCGPCCLT